MKETPEISVHIASRVADTRPEEPGVSTEDDASSSSFTTGCVVPDAGDVMRL